VRADFLIFSIRHENFARPLSKSRFLARHWDSRA